jgi:hypothetical protein
MTQGRDGISLAHRAALSFWEVARQLSVVAAMFTVAAVLAATADPGYAGGKKKISVEDRVLENTVVVSNNGAILGGSLTTYVHGSRDNAKPLFEVKGNHTVMGAGGVQGNAQSSADGHIVVTSSAASLVLSFGPGSNGNTAPDTLLAGPNTGINTPQGATFQNPFRESVSSQAIFLADDIFANSNFLGVVIADADHPLPLGCSVDANDGTVGTITEFFRTDSGNVFPLNNSPVTEAHTPTPIVVSATIGGCDTALFGPVGLAFDVFNNLWAANGLAPFVVKFEAGDSGDASPIDIVGLFPPTAGDLVDPQYVAVGADGTELYVSEPSLNRIRVFDVSIPFDAALINTITAKLNRPMGIASNDTSGGDDLYVVNNGDNSLLMFDDTPFSTPTVVIRENNRNQRVGRTHLNLPVGVALPQFAPLL